MTERKPFHCCRCGHDWLSRLPHPSTCPHCATPHYDDNVGQLAQRRQKIIATIATTPDATIGNIVAELSKQGIHASHRFVARLLSDKSIRVPRERVERTSPKRSLIMAAYQRSPRPTLKEIGLEVGLSRERVRQILNTEGVTTKPPTVHCSRCGKRLYSHNKGAMCRECLKTANLVKLICSECGRPFLRKRSRIRLNEKAGYNSAFCGRKCLGKHMARLGGFGVHPDNALYHDQWQHNQAKG